MEDNEIKIGYLPNFASISYNISDILKTIYKKINDEDYEGIKEIIYKQHELIFTYTNLVNENRPIIQELFSESEDFINIIHDIIGLLGLNNEEIIFLNKMIYDYFEFYNRSNMTPNSNIRDKLLSISYTINRQSIIALISKMSVNNARLLSIVMKSSFKTEKVVHRVNNFLIENMDLSIDEIVDILLIIYPKEKLPDFVCYTMFEYSPGNGDILRKFNKISDALLKIISNEEVVSFELFKAIFSNYGNMIKMLGVSEDRLRFKFKEVIKDPHNILMGYIKAIEYAYDIYIP